MSKRPNGLLRLSVAALLIWAAAVQAQNADWRVYKASDGLPESVVVSISPGPHNSIWVKHLNTAQISSLDGYEIKTFRSPGPGNHRIYESAGGQIWTVASEGLQQLVGTGWVEYPIPEIASEFQKNNLSLFRPFTLYPTRQNRVVFLVPGGLMEFNADQGRNQTIPLRPASAVRLSHFSSMAVARDGGLWIAASNGLVRIPGPPRNIKPGVEWREYPLDEKLNVRNLRDPVEEENGTVTAIGESSDGTRRVLARFDGKDWSIESLPEESIGRAWHGPNNSRWAMNSYTLYKWNEARNEWTANEEIPSRRFFDQTVDATGAFWLATSDGLFRYAPLTWQPPRAATKLNQPIYAMTSDRDGRVWVSTANALHSFKDDQSRDFPFPREMSIEIHGVRALFALTNNTIVLEAGEQLFQFNQNTEQFRRIPRGQTGRMKPLGVMRDGTLCLQALNPGSKGRTYQLEIYDGERFSPFPYTDYDLDLGNNLVFLYSGPSGSLWLGGDKGVALYRDNKWERCGSIDLPPEGPVSMAELGDGTVWCGVQDKILEFAGHDWKLIRSGFDRINSMAKARDGSVWVASDSGVQRFFRGAWIGNDIEEGLPSDAVHGICEDTRGNILAATARGLSVYHPEADSEPPQTFAAPSSDMTGSIPEGEVVNVIFSGRDRWKQTPASRLLFSYRLDDQEWSPFQEQRSAYFSDLPTGKHYLKVRSMDRNWNVDPKPAVLEFAVALPWYKESRLLLISFAGLAVTIFFAGLALNRHARLVRSYAEVEAKVAMRTKQLEIANRELVHSQKMNALGTLAAGIAHDFNNILSIIKGSAQIIEDNLEHKEKIRARAGRILTVVEQGSGIVNAMLGFSRTSETNISACDVNKAIQETIQLLGDRFQHDVVVHLDAQNNLPPVMASKDFIQQILLNLIFNAAEAMTQRDKRIILSTRRTDILPSTLALAPANASPYVLISVRDFGCGISPEILPRIFEPFFTTKSFSARRGTGLGLSMAYELARQMEAGLAVESTPGHGSLFVLIIPVRKPHPEQETASKKATEVSKP